MNKFGSNITLINPKLFLSSISYLLQQQVVLEKNTNFTFNENKLKASISFYIFLSIPQR